MCTGEQQADQSEWSRASQRMRRDEVKEGDQSEWSRASQRMRRDDVKEGARRQDQEGC